MVCIAVAFTLYANERVLIQMEILNIIFGLMMFPCPAHAAPPFAKLTVTHTTIYLACNLIALRYRVLSAVMRAAQNAPRMANG